MNSNDLRDGKKKAKRVFFIVLGVIGFLVLLNILSSYGVLQSIPSSWYYALLFIGALISLIFVFSKVKINHSERKKEVVQDSFKDWVEKLKPLFDKLLGLNFSINGSMAYYWWDNREELCFVECKDQEKKVWTVSYQTGNKKICEIYPVSLAVFKEDLFSKFKGSLTLLPVFKEKDMLSKGLKEAYEKTVVEDLAHRAVPAAPIPPVKTEEGEKHE